MKSILLTSTALIALGGAAFAEAHGDATGVSFAGEATLGYNDDALGDNEGFYWDGNIAVTATAALNGGVTASATFDFDVASVDEDGDTDGNGLDLSSGGFLLSVTSANASLFFGDTAFAAETYWASAGDMEGDAFSEADGETVLRGEAAFGGVTAGLSYVVADADGNVVGDNSGDDVDQLSLGATGEFGGFSVAVAYQDESIGANGSYDPAAANGDFNESEVFGVSASGTFAGATVTVAYAAVTDGDTSTGIKVAYPVGPVTLTGYYVNEEEEGNDDVDPNFGIKAAYASGPISVTADYQDDQGTTIIALDGSYDVGNGLSVLAGYYSEEAPTDTEASTTFYVATSYDLGGGASLLVSYAEDEDDEQEDEIGTNDYQRGTTVEVSFAF